MQKILILKSPAKKSFRAKSSGQNEESPPPPDANGRDADEACGAMRLMDVFVRGPAAAVGWLLSSLMGQTSTRGGAPRTIGKSETTEVRAQVSDASERSTGPDGSASPALNDRENSTGSRRALPHRATGGNGEASHSGRTENIPAAVPWGDLPEACVERILLGAGFQATLSATSACKSWRQVTSNQNFWRKVRADPTRPEPTRPLDKSDSACLRCV